MALTDHVSIFPNIELCQKQYWKSPNRTIKAYSKPNNSVKERIVAFR